MSATPTLIQHQERNYTSAPGSNYLLPSDEPERARLEAQHITITRHFGNKLVLSPVSLQGGDKVLDSGAGACSWVLDLARTVSNDIEIFGSDIESNLFPKELPPNVKVFSASALDLPKEWTDTFQLVHQRFLISAFTAKQWDTSISELFRVTKPGGWAEICEFGPKVVCASQPDHKLIQIYLALHKTGGHVLDISLLLPDLMKNAGFTDIHSIPVDVPLGKGNGPDGEGARNAFVGFFRGLKTPVLSRGGLGVVESEKEFDEVADDYARVSDETTDTMVMYYTVYGRKPLSGETVTQN